LNRIPSVAQFLASAVVRTKNRFVMRGLDPGIQGRVYLVIIEGAAWMPG